MMDTITITLGKVVDVGHEFDTSTDHFVVLSREWSPDCAYRKGFYWYTCTRTPLESVQKMDNLK